LAIVRKVVVTAAERIDDSTILDVAVIDHNTADPPASKQVGRSMTIEVEDDESQEGATLEDWFEILLEDVRALILSEVVAKNVHDIHTMRFAHHE
jgi:hypothetical protein